MDSTLFSVQNVYTYFDKIQAPIKKIINEEFYAENGFLERYTELYDSYYEYSAKLLQNDTTGRLYNLHQNYLKYVMRHPKLGYGHPDMIYAYNSLASTEEKIEDQIDVYFKNLEYIEYFSDEWKDSEIDKVDSLIDHQKIMCYYNILNELFWHNENSGPEGPSDFLVFDPLTLKYIDNSFLSELHSFIEGVNGWESEILNLERYYLYAKNGFLMTGSSSENYKEAFDNASIGIKKCKEYKESKPFDELDYIHSTFAQYFTETQNRVLMKLEPDHDVLEKKLRSILKNINEFQCSSLMVHDEIFKNILSLQSSEKEAQKICFEAADMHSKDMENIQWWYSFDKAQFWMQKATQYKFTSKKDRYKTIELSKRYLSYINSWDSTELEILTSCYETIANQFYWLKEYDSSVYYRRKSFELYDDMNPYKSNNWFNMIWSLQYDIGDSIRASEETNQWMTYLFGAQLIDYSTKNCKTIIKNIGKYDIPYFQIEIDLPEGFWPVIEFDINGNKKIDNQIYKRYYFDYRINQFKTEYISSLHYEMGGFKNFEMNMLGTEYQDTSSLVYFDKSPTFKSNINFIHQPSNSTHKEGYYSNDKSHKWIIEIPCEELIGNADETLNFLISFYTINQEEGQHQQKHNKYILPTEARIYGFERAFEFELK